LSLSTSIEGCGDYDKTFKEKVGENLVSAALKFGLTFPDTKVCWNFNTADIGSGDFELQLTITQTCVDDPLI